jgi:hypothetical protein
VCACVRVSSIGLFLAPYPTNGSHHHLIHRARSRSTPELLTLDADRDRQLGGKIVEGELLLVGAPPVGHPMCVRVGMCISEGACATLREREIEES